jgi:hypothetical protein
MNEFDPRKYLMHCLHIARTLNPDEAVGSAERLEFVGAPLLDGLADKVRQVLDKAKAEGKL